MSRTYLHCYKILSSLHAGSIHYGVQIGSQQFPGQFTGLTHDVVMKLQEAMHKRNQCHGIWLNDVEQAVYLPVPNGRPPKVEITEQGVNYDDVYIDLCVPFDRFNNVIFVGDEVYASIGNEVVPCVVEKIAKKPYMASYGTMQRKITVRMLEGGTARTVNDSRTMVKVMK